MSLEVLGTNAWPESQYADLDPNSYTALRLHHATPQHLHLTTRRCFIGPIPQDWLKRKTHRKAWYKHSLNFSSYSSRAATFRAGDNVSNQRQTTGIDTAYSQSFPQPRDANDSVDEVGAQGIVTNDGSGQERGARIGKSTISQQKDRPYGSIAQLQVDGAQGEATRTSKKTGRASSYVTAPETREEQSKIGLDDAESAPQNAVHRPTALQSTSGASNASSVTGMSTFNTDTARLSGTANSMSPLLHDGDSAIATTPDQARSPLEDPNSHAQEAAREAKPASRPTQLEELQIDVPEQIVESSAADLTGLRKIDPVSTGLVRFNIPDILTEEEDWAKAKISKTIGKASFRKAKASPGILIKSEKMLVRVDSTVMDLPREYDENSSMKIEYRTVEKWREFVVVCRKCTDETADYVVQMYKSRVIPAIEGAQAQKGCVYEVPLIRKTTRLNLYSSLDKTIVMWAPYKKGTRIYILRPRSSASSVEWYTFLRSTIGWKRPSSLKVNVPDLNLMLQLANPFEELGISRDIVETAQEDTKAMMKLIDTEKTIASTIVNRCMNILRDSPEVSNVIDKWSTNERMGLAWKRYDRLEWVHGANEQKMYGTLAMERSHDLELRPKQHYPTNVSLEDKTVLEEPAPIEGYLIRLTSQKGREQRFGKNFSKRSYFSTHNQFLCFCKPAKAMPPTPPKLPKIHGSQIPTMGQIAEKIPLIYAVNPYPTSNGQISWLAGGSTSTVEEHDQHAFDEAERKVNILLETEGYFDMCRVKHIRDVQRQVSPSLASREQDNTRMIDGLALQPEYAHTFELVLRNDLVVRFRAYDETTKAEWVTRLKRIADYWKVRIAADLNLYKLVRAANLKILDVDEEMESFMGQYARKWEVTRSVASPELYNMCGISCCRTVTMSGTLYRKSRMHSTFQRCNLILCHGHLLVFQGTVRKHSGKELPHTHHQRQEVLDLKNTYIYSGLITEGDLLYQNQTFDSNHPGHHALPRVYLEDSWTSSDEDTTTCFVIWYNIKKSFFMASPGSESGKSKSRLRYVSRLGVAGRSVVFKTRSRAERDHWVMNIGMEIERVQQAEDIRVVSKK